MRNVYLVTFGPIISLAGNVDELEKQWSSCDDAAPPGQEISANNVLEYGGFAGRLGADYDLCHYQLRDLQWISVYAQGSMATHDLWKIQGIVSYCVENEVLQFVDDPQ